jgi:hypothetical protein
VQTTGPCTSEVKKPEEIATSRTILQRETTTLPWQIDDNSPKCTQPGTHGEITILGEKKWCGTHDQEVKEHSQGVTEVLPANLHHKTQWNS